MTLRIHDSSTSLQSALGIAPSRCQRGMTEAQELARRRNFAIMQLTGMASMTNGHLSPFLTPELTTALRKAISEAELHLRKELSNGTPRK